MLCGKIILLCINSIQNICIAYRMEKTKIIIHETDERMFFLKKILSETVTDKPTHIFAPNINVNNHLLEDIEDASVIVCGKHTEEAALFAKERDITIYNIMKNEKFQAVNSRLTAEGALGVILEHSVKSIKDCKMLVIGFGRTGAAMAKLLNDLNVDFDVATTSSLRPAFAFAQNVIAASDFDFAPYDVVVNSVPYPIIKDSDAMTFKQNAIYIDLASKPALNLEYAKYLGVDADIYPALPAKVCPLSAAKAMQEYISEVVL